MFDEWIHVREPAQSDLPIMLNSKSQIMEWSIWLPYHGKMFEGNLKGMLGELVKVVQPLLRDTFYCLGMKKRNLHGGLAFASAPGPMDGEDADPNVGLRHPEI